MNDWLQMLILGIVQGVGEFLPISSSGHLVLTEQVLHRIGGGPAIAEGKDVEVLLHLGTLGAILVVYWNDLLLIARQPRTIALLVLSTLPAGVVGLTLKDWFETAFDAPILAGFGLLVTAGLLLVGQASERPRHAAGDMPWLVGFLIGCFQAVALVPGISRSGSTISGALLLGVDRVAATRFSFLLAIPVTCGAILLTLIDVAQAGRLPCDVGLLLFGITVSFGVGLASLNGLIRLISRRKLHWFAIYCAIVGLVTIALCVVNPPVATEATAPPPTHAPE
jgi:undecaprenyl-diphosphatase